MNIVVRYLFLITAIVSATSSCSHHSSSTNDKVKSDTVDLKIGLMPVSDCLPLYVADLNREFTRNGITVKVISYNSMQQCADAFYRGKIDGAYLTLPDALYCNQNGVNMKAIMGCDGQMTLIANGARRIRKLASIKGHTIALSRHNTSEYLADIIAKMVKAKRIDILCPQINDIFVRTDMLGKKQIDVAVLPSPYDGLSAMQGNVALYSTQDAGIRFGSLCFHDSVIAHKSDKIAKLVKAFSSMASSINRDRHVADTTLLKVYKVPGEWLDSVKLPVFASLKAVVKADYERAVAWSLEKGYIKKKPEMNDVVSYKFAEK